LRRTAIAVIALSPACAAPPAPQAIPKPDLGAAPETAAEIARDLVRGRAGGLFEVKRFRFLTSGAAIGRLALWGPSLTQLGLDPMFDVERAFVTSEHALGDSGIAVLEMARSDREIAAALASNGLTDRDGAFPSTQITLPPGTVRIVALVRPGLVVVAPPWQASRLEPLRSRARLPRIKGPAAARFFAFDPSSSLGSMPSWPTSLRAAHAELVFEDNGGATITFFAQSLSDDQARADAQALTDEAHRLLAVSLGLFEMHLLDPPKFQSEGSLVLMKTSLLPGDVDWILGYTGKP
jgi:hypothetical protein